MEWLHYHQSTNCIDNRNNVFLLLSQYKCRIDVYINDNMRSGLSHRWKNCIKNRAQEQKYVLLRNSCCIRYYCQTLQQVVFGDLGSVETRDESIEAGEKHNNHVIISNWTHTAGLINLTLERIGWLEIVLLRLRSSDFRDQWCEKHTFKFVGELRTRQGCIVD